MPGPLSFSDLISPLSTQQFFAEFHGNNAIQLSGRRRRFASIFSWAEFNRLLNMTTVWSDATMKIVLNGRELSAAEFCQPVRNRDGHNVMQPDPRRVNLFLGQGATVVLDLAERLSEGLALLSDSLQSALGAPISCNIYCSWEQQRGFPVHFDTMDVFALQIDGEKTWQLYEGRFENPVEHAGYNYSSLPRAHHAVAKGKLANKSVMTPGDLLYIPRGQYHEALASKQASLHLSFGVTEATGQDFLAILLNSLNDDPLFRAALPHFDNRKTHVEHLEKLSTRLAEICAHQDTSKQMRDYQRRRAFRNMHPNFSLPDQTSDITYRVHLFGVTVTSDETASIVEGDTGQTRFEGENALIIHWIRQRDLFTKTALEQKFPVTTDEDLRHLIDELTKTGLISPVW